MSLVTSIRPSEEPRYAAILFTDVVDSTQWQRIAGDDAARPVWAAHDAAARRLLRHWRGQEVGRADGFLVLFEACHDAKEFASAYHAALASLQHPFAARVGIHWGQVVMRENPPDDRASGAIPFDVDGLALHVAARVMAVAQGGQTLITAEVVAQLSHSKCVPSEIVSHGHWRMKGLEEPIELFEAMQPATPALPPPDGAKAYRVLERDGLWAPTREVPSNLGRELDRFIGRQAALRDLAMTFDAGARLVTLVGTGGVGKTRLARRYAQAWLGDYPGGSWFCDLSNARSLDGIALAVAQALQVPLGQADPVQQLAAVLRGRGDCLLVLDNFEQVASCALATAGAWATGAPGLRMLVTSREVLGLPGEMVQMLAPLNSDEAIQLYLQRLRDGGCVAPLEASDGAALPQLVSMLDELPLAIELSAARVRSVGPAEQLRRIGERFRLLAVSGRRHDRQATIRATLDWSWELLDDAERVVLAQVSVFDGGFTLQAAEETCELPPSSSTWIADLLQSLVEKSLLRRSSLQRFDLLRTVQDYGRERLGAEAHAIRLRHARHFAKRTDSALQFERGVELDNLVAACRWATAESAKLEEKRSELKELAVSLLVRVWSVLRLTGPFRAAIDLAKSLQDLVTLDAASAAQVCRVLGAALGLIGRTEEARDSFEAGIQWAEEALDFPLRAHLQCLLADLNLRSGRLADAETLLDQARAIEANQQIGLILASTEAQVAMARSDLVHARQCFEEALTIARKQGDLRWEGGIQGDLGRLAIISAQPAIARLHLSEALRCAADLRDRQWEGNAHCNLGYLLFEEGELGAAVKHLTLSLELSKMLGHRWLEATALCNLGLVYGAQGAHGDAVAHLLSAVRTAHELGAPALEGQFMGYLATALAAADDLPHALETFERAQILLGAPELAQDRALLLSQRCQVLAQAGRAEEAASDLQAASDAAAKLSAAPNSELARTIAAARSKLS